MSGDYEGPDIRTGGGFEAEGGAHGGWTRWADMTAALDGAVPVPEVFPRTDGRASFYRGKVNAVVGESEGGKSLLVQAACAQALGDGESVVYLDFEDTPISVAHRLRSLGVEADAIATRFHYIQPEGFLPASECEALLEALDLIGPAIVVVDGLTACMESLGLETSSNKDAATVFRVLLNPLTECGAAVITIHHVTKANDGRGTYGLGAVTLKNLIGGAQYGIETEEATRHAPGRCGASTLTIHKDRGGGVRVWARSKMWATFETDSKPTGEVDTFDNPTYRTTWALKVPGESWGGPTACMEAISRHLVAEGESLSLRAIHAADLGAKFGKDIRTNALGLLVANGHVSKIGKGGTKGTSAGYLSAKPYREPSADDLAEAERARSDSNL